MEFLPKRIPYGLASFQAVRDAGLAFVDKTKVIEALERLEIRFPLLLRPRRFWKTFLTTMLEAYYDKASAADFDRLFAGTYIHAHRTASQGQFHVLRLDFSGIDSTLVVDGFIRKLLLGMSAFFKKSYMQALAACTLYHESRWAAGTRPDCVRLFGSIVRPVKNCRIWFSHPILLSFEGA